MILAWVKALTKTQKSAMFLALDSALLLLALVSAFITQNLEIGTSQALLSFLPVVPYLLLAAAGVSVWLGISSVQLNAYEAAAVGLTGLLALSVFLVSVVISALAGLDLPLGLHVVFGAIYFSLIVISRAVLLQVVLAIYRRGAPSCRVLIYGAGTTGSQLVSALRGHESIEPVAFVDDNVALQGLSVARLPVYTPLHISDVVRTLKIDRVLLAVPSLSMPKQAQIARRLEKMGLEVQTLPSFAQLIGEEALIDKLTPVSAHRFLNREEVENNLGSTAASYAGKSVLVSGAGGSIGSELCRQVLECRPKCLVLYELSELALYTIDMELRQLAEGAGVSIVPVLGSVTDPRQVRKVLVEHGVEIVLHAAAYKHVPLVEANALAGLVNNVFGTQTLAQQAAKAGVEHFMLISSDKAVRPTNIMGASKRLAEMVVQDLSSRCAANGGPIFSMVRFGNVLGSSGSVVPLFQDQLSRGGPLTVTDQSVTRYFMTVQEAVRLVLKAGAIAKGGEVFVLDMGKPVPILHLARQVIESAGYTVRDETNPDGDIEIEITGLRPGEKLTEELTLTGELIDTSHPKIFSTREESLSEIEIASALRGLREAFVASDEDMAREVVRRWVESAVPLQQRRISS